MLHWCNNCAERSEVWKRTKSGAHFSYCINKGCPGRKIPGPPGSETPDITSGPYLIPQNYQAAEISESNKANEHFSTEKNNG